MAELIEYIKDENRNTIGILIAFNDPLNIGTEEDSEFIENKIFIGYSKCHPKNTNEIGQTDKFDKEFGYSVASDRAIAWALEQDRRRKLPPAMVRRVADGVAEIIPFEQKMREFIERSRRYFKDCELPDWAKAF